MYLKRKKINNKPFEIRYDLILFGYVGSLVFVTKFSHICTSKEKNNNNKPFELRYDLIPFGYVGSFVFVAKHSHI